MIDALVFMFGTAAVGIALYVIAEPWLRRVEAKIRGPK